MNYQRRASPLHAARAAVGCLYCLALLVAALLIQEPIVLGAIVVSILGAGALAGVGHQLRRALLFAVPMALLIAVINMFASQQGLTVIARLGDLPVLGNTDITLEATVYGGVLALRAGG